LTPPPSKLGVTHWSSRLLAKHLKIGNATVARAWRDYGVQPWRSQTFKFSTDPQLVAKVTDAVGLYLAPPENAVVLCVGGRGYRPFEAHRRATARRARRHRRRIDTNPSWVSCRRAAGAAREPAAELVSKGRCWGYLCLHREDAYAGFASREVAAAPARLPPHIAQALRTALLVASPAPSTTLAARPGVVLLANDLSVVAMTPQAGDLLDMMDGGGLRRPQVRSRASCGRESSCGRVQNRAPLHCR
jgi:hypothetical protein